MPIIQVKSRPEADEIVLFVDGSAPLTPETQSLLRWLAEREIGVSVIDASRDPVLSPLLNGESTRSSFPILFSNGRVLGGRLLREAMANPEMLLANDKPTCDFGLRRIDCQTLAEWLDGSAPPLLVDVRTEREYLEERIAGARLLNEIMLEAISLLDRRTPLAFYCNNGVRSMCVASHHLELAFTDVSVLSGGMAVWKHQFGQQNSPDLDA